jgi:hypothetical protein
MTKSIRIDAEVDDEISHAIDRYEREREGLGAEFWDELRAAMRTLEAPGPECGSVIGLPRELGVRRKVLARFPYAIVFVERYVRPRHFRHAWSSASGLLAPPSLSTERAVRAAGPQADAHVLPPEIVSALLPSTHRRFPTPSARRSYER